MFWEFRQNNSGGSFIAPAYFVYVEADSEEEASERFQEIDGCYFDHMYIRDCACCGARWSGTYSDYPLDEVYIKIDKSKEDRTAWGVSMYKDPIPEAIIYHKNKRLEIIK